jgi:isoleucyl-tRNA synthetase
MAAISTPDLRRLCRKWAEKYVDVQRQGFERLGVLGEWQQPYLTYLPAYEAGNVKVFKMLYESGAIYRGRKPIHWCYHDHTALAEAELEYSDEKSSSIYVAFKLADKPARYPADALSPEILIWTTTPWTLPANVAVTLSAAAQYVVLLARGKALIIARELLDQVAAVLELESPKLLCDANGEPLSYRGEELRDLRYAHPILPQFEGRLVTGAHVDLDTGTGAVHTAPGHGQEDYQMGLEYDLPLLMPVDDNGVFDSGGGPFAGLVVDEANPKIIAWLKERGLLVAEQEITHSYPHCWRCKQPVIFRATDQWFVSMEATGLRARALAEVQRLRWYPSWSVKRMQAMVEGRPDWCISRQRSWGVPIPVFKCASCGSTVANAATFDAVIELFEQEGADAWFTRAPAEYLPANTACAECGSTELLPETDILDVWWESGVSHTSVLKARDYLSFPADLYLEGSDQHRGWFQSSLLTSVGAYGVAPYEGVMSCGFIVDGEGRKQSKSLGNVVDPEAVIAAYGADVLRLWVGSIDSSQDVGIDDEILKRASEAYRRFRNIFRFLLSNLYDFRDQDTLSWEQLWLQDRWALARLQQLMRAVDEGYESNRFHLVYHALHDYVAGELSAVYLDALKDRLYSEAPKSLARRSAQTVLRNILEVLVRQLAPILSFTCDEVLEFYPPGISASRPQAVMLANWPQDGDLKPQIPEGAAEPLLACFALVLRVREAVTKALEQARAAAVIGKSQEAKVSVALPATDLAVLSALPAGTLEELFIVSELVLLEKDAAEKDAPGEDAAGDGSFVVVISPAAGEKCPRCWNYRELGADPDHPQLCARCAAVLHELGK